MRPALGILVLLGGLAACEAELTDSSPTGAQDQGSAPSFRAVTTTVNQKIPIDIFVFIPCADGGAGEFVELAGNLHDIFHLTLHSDGRFTLKVHDQPQGVSGVGESTGDRYHGTGVTQETITSGRVGFTDTFVNNFRVIGQGPGNNSLVHVNTHVTVNANGTITASVINAKAECK